MAPAWIDLPENQVIEFGEELSYQLYASDPSGISQWTVDDTTHFAVVDGLVSNLVTLESGIYSIQVSVEDAYGNVVSETFDVYVLPEGGPIVPLPDLSPLYLIVGVAGGAAVMLVIMFLLNRRGSK